MVLPVHDENPLRRRPVVTYALILANVLVFVLAEPPSIRSLNGDPGSPVQQCHQLSFVERYAAVPAELVHNSPLPVRASDQPAANGCVAEPNRDKIPVLSVFTAMFLHASWLHLLGNMLFLLIFGNNVEDRLGRLRFLGFYLVCGAIAAYGFALGFPNSTQPTLGASGAIAGVLGAYLVLFPRARVWGLLTFFFFLPLRLPAWLVLGGWFVVQYVYSRHVAVSDTASVAYLAHVIGFAAGIVLVLGLRAVGFGGTAQARYPSGPGSPYGWR